MGQDVKTDFISIAAHELKTPLTLIQGYVNILREMKMEERVNMIRQMVPGLKKTRDNLNAMFKTLKAGNKDHEKFKVILLQYLELLRKAERDRQKWIKDEIKLGNANNVQVLLAAQGLDDVIRI